MRCACWRLSHLHHIPVATPVVTSSERISCFGMRRFVCVIKIMLSICFVQRQMEAVRRDLAASTLGVNGGSTAAGGRQSAAQSTEAARAAEKQEDREEDDDDDGCSYHLSDDSIEDAEADAARLESRAK